MAGPITPFPFTSSLRPPSALSFRLHSLHFPLLGFTSSFSGKGKALQKSDRSPLHPCVKLVRRSAGVLLGAAASVSCVASTSASLGRVAEEGSGTMLAGARGSRDLLVVGPGILGTLVAQSWISTLEEEEAGASVERVFGMTRTEAKHEELRRLGVVPLLRTDPLLNDGQKFPFVIFCAPPYGNDDYVGEVRAAAERWDGSGSLLFTSSSAVYAVSDNGPCYETSPVVPLGTSPRVDRLLQSEAEVLKVGGNVVRLAGLYTFSRGAHSYWLRQGTVDSRPDHILNSIHYEDAASLCVEILKSKFRGNIFMGCDDHPVTRQELMDLAIGSGKFESSFEGFTGTEGPLGKKMNNEATRELLRWQPKHSSFASFLGIST